MANPEVPSLDVPQVSLSFLTNEEESSLSETIHAKILQAFQTLTRNYHNAVNQKQRDKTSIDVNTQQLEVQVKELKEKSESLTTQLQNERKTTEEYIERYRKSLTTTNELEDNIRKLQADMSEAQIKLEQFSAEKQDLVSIVEKRNSELEKLNENVKNLSDQLQSAMVAKIDALVKVDELTSKEMELDYKEKQLESERGFITKQVHLLTAELDRKNTEIIELHRESALKFLAIQTEVSERADQLRIAELSMSNLKQSNEEQEAHIERLMQKLKESQDMEVKMEENYRQELKSQKRIAELYKDSSEEANKKAEDLEDAVSNLQDLLKLATERYGELETKFNKCGKSFQEEITKRDEQIQNLTEELTRANELLGSIKKQGLTDEMINSLSPAAAAACSLLKGSHSLTEIYSKHQSLNEQLLIARDENAKLNEYIAQIVRDIEERAPILKEQKEDYERALETVNALQDQLDLASHSEESAKREYKITKDNLEIVERENERFKSQVKDSAMQIKSLLREIESLRSGGGYGLESDQATQEVPEITPAHSIIDSSRIITDRLVTFRNIDELQQQNQYLLSLVRELSEERESAKDTIDQTHVEQIKNAFEQAKKEVNDLREARLRQERMFQGIIEQRDSYAAKLAQQKSPGLPSRSPGKPLGLSSPLTPVGSGSISLSTVTEQAEKISSLEKQIIELTATHKILKEEYETYRKEKREHEKIASEQMERVRDDLTRIRSENAKLSSQTEYNNERGKIYAANLETYKKSIAVLEEKNKQYNVTIMKHEESIVALKTELATTTNKMVKAEVALQSMVQERNMLRDSKSHLEAEKNLFQKEQMTQKVLQLNLADIKNNLDMANSGTRIKLENQIESLQKECTILRRRVDSENDRFKDTVLSWDKMNKEISAKLEKEQEEHLTVKKQLLEAQDAMKTQRTEIDELLVKVRVLTGSGTQKQQSQFDAIPTLAQIELEKKTKELNLKLIESQTEIRSVKQQLELARASVEEYKALSNSMEQQLQNAATSRENYNSELAERLACKDDIIREIQAKLDTTDNENSKLREENEKLQRDIEGKSNTVDEELTRMRRELQIANSKLQSITEENVVMRNDLELQLKQTEEFRTKYENELRKISNEADIKELQEALNNMNSRLNETDRLKKRVEESAIEKQALWEVHEKTYKEQLEQMEKSLAEVESLNNSLQDQLIAMTTQLTSLRDVQREGGQEGDSMNQSFVSASGDLSFNTSFSEQERKTTEQWMQLVRYMRRQKDIAFSQKELAQTAMQRMETQLQYTEKQFEEVKTKLNESQDGSQVNFITSAKQSELLRKVETLSALTDSNRMLREEKESALKEVSELKSKLESIEKEMGPLRNQTSELESKCEGLNNENAAVKQDAARWRARASALLEKSNKFNPEEWKKLENEKDNLHKQVLALNENVKKQQQEIARQGLTVNRLQQQIVSLQTSNNSLTNEKKAITEEAKKTSEECSRVKTDLASLASELERTKSLLAEREAELVKVREELTTTAAQVETERGVVRQVKLIARRYKKSFEDTQKENETLLEQKQTLEKAAAESRPPPSEHKETQEDGSELAAKPPAEVEAEVSTLTAKVQEMIEVKENLMREIESLKSREERAKSAMKATRDKISASNSRTSELETGISDLQTKLASLETSKEEADVRQAAVKSQYEGRIARLEKEKKDLQASLAAATSTTSSAAVPSELASENERLKNEVDMQRQRILAIEKQYKLQISQAQTPKGSGAQDKSIVEPPKANIKPISGTKASSSPKQATQVVPPGTSRPQPTASIRPMSMPRKATVMPTASATPSVVQIVQQQSQQQHSMVSPVAPLAPVSQAQVSTSTPDQSSSVTEQQHLPVTSSAATGTVTNSTNVRQATVQPTPAISTPSVASTPTMSSSSASTSAAGNGSSQVISGVDRESIAIGEEGPSTSSNVGDSDLGDSSEQVSSSEPSNNQHVINITPIRGEQRPIQSSSSQPQPAPSSEIQKTVPLREEPSPSTSFGPRPTQSTKRLRTSELSSEAKLDEPELKRTRVNVPIPVEREAEAMAHQQEPQHVGQEFNEADQKSAIGSASGGAQDDDDDSDVIVIDDSDNGDEDDERSPSRYQSRSHGRSRVHEELDEEEEFEEDIEDVEEEEIVDDEERAEDEEEDDEGGVDDEEDEADEGMELQDDESVGEPEEGREAESLVDTEGNDVGASEDNLLIPDARQDSRARQDQLGSDDENELSIEPESEVQEGGEASPAQEPSRSRGPTSSTMEVAGRSHSSNLSRPVPALRPVARAGSSPYNRQALSYSQQPSGYGDEADDSIVPRTPTLVVPRRTDGFAEAISSPQVPSQARFTFSSASGMDLQLQEARMEMLQYDDGTGRSVPTTPLQGSPPVVDIEHHEPEEMVRQGDDSSQESNDVQPSSSDARHRTNVQDIPSITVTSALDSTAERAEQESEHAQHRLDISPDDGGEDQVVLIPGRTESSVTSSDEDKLDANAVTDTSASSQQPSTSSLSRPTSPSPSQGPFSSDQQPQQHRVRPTPIIWDQPTSSSSALQQVPQQRPVRGRGSGNLSGAQSIRPMMQLNPEQMAAQNVHGGFHPLRGVQQSARRSRPHGRGIMRGSRGGGAPY